MLYDSYFSKGTVGLNILILLDNDAPQPAFGQLNLSFSTECIFRMCTALALSVLRKTYFWSFLIIEKTSAGGLLVKFTNKRSRIFFVASDLFV